MVKSLRNNVRTQGLAGALGRRPKKTRMHARVQGSLRTNEGLALLPDIKGSDQLRGPGSGPDLGLFFCAFLTVSWIIFHLLHDSLCWILSMCFWWL